MPAPGRVQDDVVVVPGGVQPGQLPRRGCSLRGLVGDLLGRHLLPVEGMEPGEVVGGCFLGQLVVDVVEEVLDGLVALVAELYPGGGTERHGEVGVHRRGERALGAAPGRWGCPRRPRTSRGPVSAGTAVSSTVLSSRCAR